MERDPKDHKGLIRESYRIEGITEGECRSIFLDWALSVPDDQDSRAWIVALLEQYELANPDHPMTSVLTQGLEASKPARRRGGWRSRPREPPLFQGYPGCFQVGNAFFLPGNNHGNEPELT